MVGVYLLFLVSAAVSILLYGAQKSAVKIGFGLSAISRFTRFATFKIPVLSRPIRYFSNLSFLVII